MAKARQYQSQEWAKHIRPYMRKRANKVARRMGKRIANEERLRNRGR